MSEARQASRNCRRRPATVRAGERLGRCRHRFRRPLGQTGRRKFYRLTVGRGSPAVRLGTPGAAVGLSGADFPLPQAVFSLPEVAYPLRKVVSRAQEPDADVPGAAEASVILGGTARTSTPRQS